MSDVTFPLSMDNPLVIVASDAWRPAVESTHRTVSRFAQAAKSHANRIKLAALTWSLDGSLRGFLDKLYRAVENPPAKIQKPVTRDQVLETAKMLRGMFDGVEKCFAGARLAGLTNTWYMGAALNSVMKRAEEILDISEWLELAVDPSLPKRFEQSLEELKRGEVFDLPVYH